MSNFLERLSRFSNPYYQPVEDSRLYGFANYLPRTLQKKKRTTQIPSLIQPVEPKEGMQTTGLSEYLQRAIKNNQPNKVNLSVIPESSFEKPVNKNTEILNTASILNPSLGKSIRKLIKMKKQLEDEYSGSLISSSENPYTPYNKLKDELQQRNLQVSTRNQTATTQQTNQLNNRLEALKQNHLQSLGRDQFNNLNQSQLLNSMDDFKSNLFEKMNESKELKLNNSRLSNKYDLLNKKLQDERNKFETDLNTSRNEYYRVLSAEGNKHAQVLSSAEQDNKKLKSNYAKLATKNKVIRQKLVQTNIHTLADILNKLEDKRKLEAFGDISRISESSRGNTQSPSLRSISDASWVPIARDLNFYNTRPFEVPISDINSDINSDARSNISEFAEAQLIPNLNERLLKNIYVPNPNIKEYLAYKDKSILSKIDRIHLAKDKEIAKYNQSRDKYRDYSNKITEQPLDIYTELQLLKKYDKAVQKNKFDSNISNVKDYNTQKAVTVQNIPVQNIPVQKQQTPKHRNTSRFTYDDWFSTILPVIIPSRDTSNDPTYTLNRAISKLREKGYIVYDRNDILKVWRNIHPKMFGFPLNMK